MLRGQIAKTLGIDAETIRFYENERLITTPKRLANGYRVYSEANIFELKFILHCKSLGMNMDEIRKLKDLSKFSGDCSQVNSIIDKNLKLIEEKIKGLKNLRNQLKILSESCSKSGAPIDCEIVKTLSRAAQGENCICHG